MWNNTASDAYFIC